MAPNEKTAVQRERSEVYVRVGIIADGVEPDDVIGECKELFSKPGV